MTVKVRGNVQLDKFTGGLVLNISQMEQGKEKKSTMRIWPKRRAWNSIFIRK